MARVLDFALKHVTTFLLVGILAMILLALLMYPGLCVGNADRTRSSPPTAGPMCTI